MEIESIHEDSEESTMQQSAQNSNMDNSRDAQNGILIVYFSRWGNTEFPDGLDASASASLVVDGDTYGTTEYVARMIQGTVGGDIHFIQTKEAYPTDFDELTDQNYDEMDGGCLPPLAESNLDVSQYDTVFIGYPVWAADVPQAVLSFLAENDLSGKTVIPFCTHDGYGAGSSYSTVGEASHAGALLDGIAIEAGDVPASHETVADWLKTIGMAGGGSWCR